MKKTVWRGGVFNGIRHTNIKHTTYYKITIIKAVWYWDMNKGRGKNIAKKLNQEHKKIEGMINFRWHLK